MLHSLPGRHRSAPKPHHSLGAGGVGPGDLMNPCGPCGTQHPTPSVPALPAACAHVRRNLHPTTTLLAPFHGSRRAPLPGVLAISSRGVALYCQPPSLASAATSGAAARQQQRAAAAASSSSRAAGPQSDGTAALEGLAIAAAESGTVVVELAQFGMQGLPACCEELAPGVLAVADSAAGACVHLYVVGGRARGQIEPGGCMGRWRCGLVALHVSVRPAGWMGAGLYMCVCAGGKHGATAPPPTFPCSLPPLHRY